LTAPLADAAEQLLDQAEGASQRLLLSTLAYYLLWTGQTPRLDRMLVRIDRLGADATAAAPATLLRWYGVSVLIRALLGRIPEALADAQRALVLTHKAPAPMRAKAQLMMVLAALAARDAELARHHLGEAATVLAAGNPIDVTTYDFQRGMLLLLEGDWAGAAQLMRASVPSGRASGWPLREHIALLGQALSATQVGALDEAETALAAALAHRFHVVCRWHHWIAGLIEAHLAERRGDRSRALAALSRALSIGRDAGFDFGPMPFCCGDMMPRLAALALAHGIDPPFVERMVQRHALSAPAGTGDAWPWPVRVRTLGRFAVERLGRSPGGARKESRKLLDLLKLLVALGGHAVPVQRLCDSLWPDAPGDAARNSFDNTLHRLRKWLGADHHVLLQDGALSLNASTCWVDLWALDAALGDAGIGADMRLRAPEADALEAWVDRILALYQGEFLSGEEGAPALLAARAHLQARFTRQMGALGAELEACGKQASAVRLYQRVVEQQPLAEDVVRRLMACLLAMGLPAEAFEAYRRCRHQMSVLLGLRPAPETEVLVSGLRDL
jgi:DNA-binding SARP family transcriptional activator